MFERRLQWFLIGLFALAALLVARLVHLQAFRAEHYRALAAEMATQPTRYLPAPRGAIRDRRGDVLLCDEPTSDISIHYAVLTFSDRQRYLRGVARRLRREGAYAADMPLDAVVADLQQRVALMWQELAGLSGVPVQEMVRTAEQVRDRVEAIRAAVAARTGVQQPVREERVFHPIIAAADPQLALAVRMQFEDCPWLRVVPNTRRIARDADPLCHLLGQTGEASADRIDADPLADDPLRRLRPGDRCGVSGVERLCERVLRGTRGKVVERLDQGVAERVEPIPGRDVRLAIDPDLQQYAYERLAAGVADLRYPSGAAAVVLDAQTREALALATLPIYDYDRYREDYVRLRRDTKRIPLRSRAISTAYAPGSTCKAITLVAGLTDGQVRPDENLECTGFLLPENKTIFRCWYYNQYGRVHGPETAVDAVRDSCNIYFFKLGGRLGPQRLCEYFEQFGFGRSAGTGLIEETPGIVPDDAWMERRGLRRERGDAWNYAIGQGAVVATPLQVANVAASVATGRWAPVRFVCDKDGRWLNPCDADPIVFDEAALRVLRKGMWEVVNSRRGTGRTARLDSETVQLCGKTGSAQTQPHVVSYKYVLEDADGARREVVAPSEADALADSGDPQPRVVGRFAYERYPPALPGERLPVHAWFMGYTQPHEAAPSGDGPTGRSYAVAVLVEFAGSGGREAAPIAKEIIAWLIARDEGRPPPTVVDAEPD